jgi:competence protein ComEA
MSATILKKSAAALPLAFALALGVSFTPTTTGQTAAPATSAKVKAKAKTKTTAKSPLDLNKATAEDMVEVLPGVGEVTARKIVAGRPYTSVSDLAKAGVPARTIEAIRPLVTVAPTPARVPAATQTKTDATGKAMTKPAATAGKLDLNKATAEQMVDTLPGVGEMTARKIIAGRPYTSVSDLAKAGVPARTIAGIRDLVAVAPPAAAATVPPTRTATPSRTATRTATPTKPAMPRTGTGTAAAKTKEATKTDRLAPGQVVNINTASKEELDLLPGIGPVKAQAIIDSRPFKTKEDVMKVKGIKESEFSKIKDIITVN